MTDYTYCVTLSITHPSIMPEEITAALNIEPTHSNKIGEQRTTSKGKLLEGKCTENLWRFTPHEKIRLSADDIFLEDYLLSLNQEYGIHKKYFSHLVETGGYIEYFIGWFEGDHNLVATFSPKLLKSTSELNIAIGLDAYPK